MRPQRESVASAGKCVVIVDDDAGSLAFLRNLFEVAAFDHVVAYNDPLHAFREIVRTGCPDLIVAESHMHRLSGVDLLNELSMLYGRITAIVVTGDSAHAHERDHGFPVIDKGDEHLGTVLLALAGRLLGGNYASIHIAER